MSSQAAVAWANKQVGTHEVPSGSNKGPKITQWEVDSGYPWVVNAKEGVFWCQCFANAVAAQGGAVLIKDGYTPDFLLGHFAAKGYHVIPVDDAEPGDMIYFNWPGIGSTICDHVGILLAKTRTTVTCVEGNTSGTDAGSQNNGGGVYIKTRSRSLVAGAVSVPYQDKSAVYRNLKDGMVGDDVRAFQKAGNDHSLYLKRSDRLMDVDGEVGSQTIENGAWVAYMMGIGDSTTENKSGGLSEYLQTLVRNPDKRNAEQKKRAAQRREAHGG